MDSAVIGFLFLFGIVHLLLVAVPLGSTLRSQISLKSKLLWCAFLVFLPFVGAAYFHFRYRSSLFLGKSYDPSVHDLGARNWSDSPHDRD